MSNFATGNPVPSIDPRDLDDNATILDNLVNGPLLGYANRLGVMVRSFNGLKADAAAFSSANVTAFSSLTGAADRIAYFTGAASMAVTPFTSQARSLLSGSSFPAMLTTLGAVNKAGDALSGTLSFAPTQSIASATTVTLGATTSNIVVITGTNTITGFTSAVVGTIVFVTFAASLNIAHNATGLILPGGVNILTAAGDTAVFESLGGGNWRCRDYIRANGRSITFEYGRADVLGTVTQSGGVPTGALFETNAGSTYRKYADGTAEVIMTIDLGTVAAGATFVSTFTYPISFIAAPSVFSEILASFGYKHGSGPETSTTTNCTVSYINNHTAALAMKLQILAKGRWF